MRLVFMGTPSFVVPVLEGLVAAEDVRVVGVFTPPDRPRGREEGESATTILYDGFPFFPTLLSRILSI